MTMKFMIICKHTYTSQKIQTDGFLAFKTLITPSQIQEKRQEEVQQCCNYYKLLAHNTKNCPDIREVCSNYAKTWHTHRYRKRAFGYNQSWVNCKSRKLPFDHHTLFGGCPTRKEAGNAPSATTNPASTARVASFRSITTLSLVDVQLGKRPWEALPPQTSLKVPLKTLLRLLRGRQ